MLVQVRRDRLLLVRQHDHALAAGRLASAWRGRSGELLPFRTVLATGLHDLAWRRLDDEPRWNPATGRPFAFHEHPLDEKLEAYARGLDRMEAVSPWVGLTGSLHYASFLGDGRAGDFLAAERRRQERLAARLRRRAGADPGAADDPVEEVRRALGWLKLFDTLSIRLCLTPPAVPDEALPAWLERDALLEAPDGTELELAWSDDRRATIRPWPLAAGLTLELPVRELPGVRFPDAGALQRAWTEADERVWAVELSPPG